MNKHELKRALLSVEKCAKSARACVERQWATLARCHAAGRANTEGQRLLSLLQDFQALHESRQRMLANRLLVLTLKLWHAH